MLQIRRPMVRHNLRLFRWNPGIDLAALFVSVALVVGLLAAATFLVTPARGGLYFLVYGIGGATLAGVGIPVLWTTLVRKQPIDVLGITTRRWKSSLAIQLLFVLPQLGKVIASTRQVGMAELAPLVALCLAIGFFEAVFWRGWTLQILERAFGLVPALVLGPALYAIYHIGYGMEAHDMPFLFLIGVLFAFVFLLTRSILALWPVFQPSGQLITVTSEGLHLPAIAAVGFAEALAVMLGICVFAEFRRRKTRAKMEVAEGAGG